MSLVAMGPLIQVCGRRGSRRATASGTPASSTESSSDAESRGRSSQRRPSDRSRQGRPHGGFRQGRCEWLRGPGLGVAGDGGLIVGDALREHRDQVGAGRRAGVAAGHFHAGWGVPAARTAVRISSRAFTTRPLPPRVRRHHAPKRLRWGRVCRTRALHREAGQSSAPKNRSPCRASRLPNAAGSPVTDPRHGRGSTPHALPPSHGTYDPAPRIRAIA